MEKEEKCCGNCCWFYSEDINGLGFCVCKKGEILDMMYCSDECEDNFVSRKEMRHHMAVLLQANKYRKDNNVPAIYKMPNPYEVSKAIEFAVRYIKTFNKL